MIDFNTMPILCKVDFDYFIQAGLLPHGMLVNNLALNKSPLAINNKFKRETNKFACLIMVEDLRMMKHRVHYLVTRASATYKSYHALHVHHTDSNEIVCEAQIN